MPMIRSQSFSGPMPLDCGLTSVILVFFSSLLIGTGRLEWPGIGYLPCVPHPYRSKKSC